MADLDQLKQKYSLVLQRLDQFAPFGATIEAVDLDGERLHIKGSVPSTVVANRIWDAIKAADPNYADLHHEIATTGSEDQPYTIRSGDTLSAICVLFYGNASKYRAVAVANNINPDTIAAGQTIQLPVLS